LGSWKNNIYCSVDDYKKISGIEETILQGAHGLLILELLFLQQVHSTSQKSDCENVGRIFNYPLLPYLIICKISISSRHGKSVAQGQVN
jgi:hypothetical protein